MMGNKSIKQSWWQMTSIQIGGAICLPIIMVGQELARNYGFAKAALSIIIGNVLLFLIGVVKVKMAYENKKTTIRNAEGYFGNKGIKFFALNIIIGLLGWFAIQLNVISVSFIKGLKTMFGYSPVGITCMSLVFGLIITMVTLRGIKAIKTLSYISIPILTLSLIYTIYKAFMYGSAVAVAPVISTSALGISLVLASTLVVIIDLPTYYRFSRSLKDSCISIFVTMVLATSAIELAGTYIATRLPGKTILELLTAYSGFSYQIIILFFLALAGWTASSINLYSAAMTLEKIFPKLSHLTRTLMLGALGTGLACFNLLAKFQTILSLIGILISSMGAVIVTKYLVRGVIPNLSKSSVLNLIAWGLGVAQGFLVFFNVFSITGKEIIDAFLMSAIAALFFALLKVRKVVWSSEMCQKIMQNDTKKSLRRCSKGIVFVAKVVLGGIIAFF